MFGNLLDIEASEDNRRFCPFTGGDDILIQRKNATSVAVIHEPTPEDDGSTPFSVATYDDTTSAIPTNRCVPQKILFSVLILPCSSGVICCCDLLGRA